jgi:hypothetical protein
MIDQLGMQKNSGVLSSIIVKCFIDNEVIIVYLLYNCVICPVEIG